MGRALARPQAVAWLRFHEHDRDSLMPPWEYRADENPKRKHHWNEPRAGFVIEGGENVGKCPCTISRDLAEHLLNDQGIVWNNPRLPSGTYPGRIYVVHEGVVYRATPTIAGVSYHAFPELPERLRGLPKKVRERILGLAENLGCRKEVQAWMDG